MRSYDNDKMNYDENGLYPDKKPRLKRHPKFSKAMGFIALFYFLGTFCCFFIFSKNGFTILYLFFSLWLVIGILGFLTELVGEGRKPQKGIYPIIGIGVFGIIFTALISHDRFGPIIALLKVTAIAAPLVVTVLGTIYSVKKGKNIFRSKDNCTQSVMATCTEVSTSEFWVNERIKKVYFTPKYLYSYEGRDYRVTSAETASVRREGMEYEIFIDPENPKDFHDPEALKVGLLNFILTTLLSVALPLSVLVLFIYVFIETRT